VGERDRLAALLEVLGGEDAVLRKDGAAS
jgi:hypothetical protein